ncbi:hypothetical protein HKD37_06G017249 [Glycine soja]
MQSQGLAMPPEPELGPSASRVSTKESCVDPSGNNPDTGDSDKCGLYIKEKFPRLVALAKFYKGLTIVHEIPLLHDQVKVGVEEVRDADAPVLVPTKETLNTFLAWPTHLVKRLSEQGTMGPAKPAGRPDHEVMWDATMFGVFNEDFPLYIKHEDLSKIAHGDQCLSISVIQLHMTDTSIRVRNFDVYGFLEPQSIQRSGQSQFELESYMKNWMQNSKRDVYLGAYLNGPNNYLKGIINKSMLFFNTFALALVRNINILIDLTILHNLNRKLELGGLLLKQKGSTECGYYVIHWMSTIIIGSFKNNWETIITIGIREIEGASHLVGKVLSQS